MTGGAPTVSIVVPAYESGPFLRDALTSIAAQSVADYEVIVVDDGSTVSPEPTVRSIFPAATFVAQANAGPSAARNAGIARARGGLIAFLDADDLWTRDALASLRRGFERAPGVAFVQGHVKRVDEYGRPIGNAYLSFNVGAMLIRRGALEQVGPFDERLRQSEDVDLHIRFKEAGWRRLAIPDTVLLYRRHRDSSTAIEPPQPLRINHHASWMRLLSASLARRRERGPTDAPAGPMGGGVTAVLTVRNGRRFLPDALASIRAQGRDITAIVAVVAGEDGSFEYLGRQSDVAAVRQDGAGLAAARNRAIEMVNTGRIAFLDCDDLWHPDKTRRQQEAMAVLDRPGFSVTHFRRAAADERPLDPPRLGLTPSTLLADRAAFDIVGRFDPAMGNGCDAEWFARALRSDLPCAVAGQALMIKRIHGENLSRDPGANRRDMLRLIARQRGQAPG